MRAKFKKSLLGYSQKQVDSFVSSLNTDDLESRLKQLVDENVKISVELKVAKSGYADAAELLGETRMRVRELEEQLAAERYNLKQTENKYNQIIENMKREQEEYIRSLQLDITKPREQRHQTEPELFPGMGDDDGISPLKELRRSKRSESDDHSHFQDIAQPLKRSNRQRLDKQMSEATHEEDDDTGSDAIVAEAQVEMLDDVITSLKELQLQSDDDDNYVSARSDDDEYSASIHEANGDDFENIFYTPPAGMEHLLDDTPREGARGVMNRIYKMRSTTSTVYPISGENSDSAYPDQATAYQPQHAATGQWLQQEYRPEAQQTDYTYEQPEYLYGQQSQSDYKPETQQQFWPEPHQQPLNDIIQNQQPYTFPQQAEPAYVNEFSYDYTYPQDESHQARQPHQPEQQQQPVQQQSYQDWQQPAENLYQQDYSYQSSNQPFEESGNYDQTGSQQQPLSYGSRRSRTMPQPISLRNIKR